VEEEEEEERSLIVDLKRHIQREVVRARVRGVAVGDLTGRGPGGEAATQVTDLLPCPIMHRIRALSAWSFQEWALLVGAYFLY